MTIEAKVIEDSISEAGIRLTTFQVKYQRFIHSELMTHRHFCIGGDAVLDFDMPSGVGSSDRKVHHMTIRDFSKKWHEGVVQHQTSKHNGIFFGRINRS